MLKLDKSKKYLLACSFGPDSMALFDMLKKQGYRFMVAHVNYGARQEAAQETMDLNDYCGLNDVEIEIFYCKIPINSANFEARAREIRYEFFKKIYDQYHLDGLIVGHQQDDFIETYYLQRKRGGFVERYGIMPFTKLYGMNVYRPLLDYSKQSLLDYCQQYKVPYAIDQSNFSQDFSRNIVRANIVSKMSKHEREQTILEIKQLNEEIDGIYQKILSKDINCVKDLLLLNDEELQRALVLKARKIEDGAFVSSSLCQEIKKILQSDKPNVSFKIHKGLIFVKEYEWCDFINEHRDVVFNFIIDRPKVMETSYFYLDFRSDTKQQNITLEDYPLTIRSPKNDDEITISNYTVELRRLFIDWKMPASLRKRWPVILNKDGKIIYVPRYRKNFKIIEGLNFYVKTDK